VATRGCSPSSWLEAFERRAGADLDFPEGGFMFGDWLDASAPDDQPWKARVPWQVVATAYLAPSAHLVSQAAAVP
jgi:alpha-L-rhamnosidase